jgi:hypothetical protein
MSNDEFNFENNFGLIGQEYNEAEMNAMIPFGDWVYETTFPKFEGCDDAFCIYVDELWNENKRDHFQPLYNEVFKLMSEAAEHIRNTRKN